MIGRDGQLGEMVSTHDAADAIVEAVAENLQGQAESARLRNKLGKRRIDFNPREASIHFAAVEIEQGHLAAHAFARAYSPRPPIVLKRRPPGQTEPLKQDIDDIDV